jgi:hypothetical protein
MSESPDQLSGATIKPQGATSRRSRRIGCHLNEADVDRVRGSPTTAPYAKAMRKRHVWVEPLLAKPRTGMDGVGSGCGGWSSATAKRC